MCKCVDCLCDKSLEAVSCWFTSGTHNELHLFTIHQDFGFIKDIAKESAAVWYNQLHFNTITICYNVTIWELHEDFCRPPYVTICCISIYKLLQKCTILHEGLCQWPLWKPQDNGKAQSNMTKQSARSVPKIEKHELKMVTKCTKWAQNSNTNVEEIRLPMNGTHWLCEIFTTRSYVKTCGWRYKEINRYENPKS